MSDKSRTGRRRQRRLLTPEQKWEIFLEVTSQELTQADAARNWGVDVSTVIRLRRDAKQAALDAFAATKPGGTRDLMAVSCQVTRCRSGPNAP